MINATLKLPVIVTMTALCIASNYALVFLPNVSLMDLIVFVGGFCFGPYVGMFIGILSWMVYGAINPFGFVPQIWLATMLSESFFGLTGGFLGRRLSSDYVSNGGWGSSVFFGFAGLISTLAYDLVTNIAYASSFGLPIPTTIIVGIPFAVIHGVSNVAIFGIGSVPLVKIIRWSLGGDGIVPVKE